MRSTPGLRCALKKRGSFWPKVAGHFQGSSPNTQQPPVGHGEVHGKRSKTTIAGEAEGRVLVEHLIVTWTLGNYGAVGNKKRYLQSNVNFVMKYFDLYWKNGIWYYRPPMKVGDIDLQKIDHVGNQSPFCWGGHRCLPSYLLGNSWAPAKRENGLVFSFWHDI